MAIYLSENISHTQNSNAAFAQHNGGIRHALDTHGAGPGETRVDARFDTRTAYGEFCHFTRGNKRIGAMNQWQPIIINKSSRRSCMLDSREHDQV